MGFLKQRLCPYSGWLLAVFWRLVFRPSLANHSGYLLGYSPPSQDISEAGLDLKCQTTLSDIFVHYNLFSLEVDMSAIIFYTSSTRLVSKVKRRYAKKHLVEWTHFLPPNPGSCCIFSFGTLYYLFLLRSDKRDRTKAFWARLSETFVLSIFFLYSEACTFASYIGITGA